jgi:mannose-6-phosphate isomerase-like protein (cupin superfamily)
MTQSVKENHMPVFRAGIGQAPAWCELEQFEFIELLPDAAHTCIRQGEKEEIVVCRGTIKAESGDVSAELTAGLKMDLASPAQPGFVLTALDGPALVLRAMGRWQSVTSSGIFSVRTAAPPTHDTPYDYRKSTGFDNHYHDCDEYWIFFSGHCRVVSEGQGSDVGPGDCLATGMGWHHDVVCILGDTEPVRAIWFEGTLEGQQRIGHLWEPSHGKAVPLPERV